MSTVITMQDWVNAEEETEAKKWWGVIGGKKKEQTRALQANDVYCNLLTCNNYESPGKVGTKFEYYYTVKTRLCDQVLGMVHRRSLRSSKQAPQMHFNKDKPIQKDRKRGICKKVGSRMAMLCPASITREV